MESSFNTAELSSSFFLIPFALCLICHLVMMMRKQCRRKEGLPEKLQLPPGSMGWPLIGETFQLYSQHPNIFFATRQQRHGEIFKTHLLGYPCVMLASPEASRFVLTTHSHLFKPTYPRSKERLIGPSALFFHHGSYHTILRKLLRTSFSPLALRRLTPAINSAASSTLQSWTGRTLSSFHAFKNLSFDIGILTIFGEHLVEHMQKNELKQNYFIVDDGYNSFPNRIPGTLYSKAVKARRRLGEILGEVVKERRAKKNGEMKDLLSSFMEWRGDEEEKLSDEQICDNIIGVLFAAQDTTASALTWVVKYLHDYPKLLEAVKDEQMAIFDLNDGGRRPLQWAQTRNMCVTHRVILESLRMASIISFTFREAVADVEYKGYLIPKGWKVMPLFRNIHHNPEFFPDPQKFDISRFNASPKPNTFLPFGTGVHSCPGNELAKLQMLIFIHHLVTKYRFEVVGSNSEVEYCPFPVPKHGLPVSLRSCSHENGGRQ
ncbi:abscisic acid 8'-hydroxylase 3-like [Phalaenopsis equestris]|uniref:abscisic acid 8'-hydroxylase 3-like n=1 Tax=Phalaenopsis equestris TaxID=78828 RepID=UPI0009E43AB0|nr:abscisic acid 8'-hydroxylase 3-like [Phalaenopsis equestris]